MLRKETLKARLRKPRSYVTAMEGVNAELGLWGSLFAGKLMSLEDVHIVI